MAEDLPTTKGGRSPAARAWRRFRAHHSAGAASLVLVVMVASVWLLPVLLGVDPNRLSEAQLAPPSREHWLGTDASGRDLLARVCAGARVSLAVGLAGAGLSLVIGVVWGSMAGYLGGRWDAVMMRAVDVLYSLPTIIFVIVLAAVLQPALRAGLERWGGGAGADASSLVFLVIGLGGISWLTMARIVRVQVASLRHRPFVEAARALGAGHVRIVVWHILPNVAGVILAYLVLTVPAVVLSESFLSYLGLGIQPPQASLGSLMADGAGQINPIRTAWWLLAGPGVVLVLLLLAASFVGDGLRDALDVRGDEDRQIH